MQVDFGEVEAQVVTGRELLLVLAMALKFRAEAIDVLCRGLGKRPTAAVWPA